MSYNSAAYNHFHGVTEEQASSQESAGPPEDWGFTNAPAPAGENVFTLLCPTSVLEQNLMTRWNHLYGSNIFLLMYYLSSACIYHRSICSKLHLQPMAGASTALNWNTPTMRISKWSDPPNITKHKTDRTHPRTATVAATEATEK